MNTAAIAPQFVHESEAQRQFARVRMPATLFVKLDGAPVRFPLEDLSAGGFCIRLGNESLRRGKVYNGRLVFIKPHSSNYWRPLLHLNTTHLPGAFTANQAVDAHPSILNSRQSPYM